MLQSGTTFVTPTGSFEVQEVDIAVALDRHLLGAPREPSA